MLRKRTCLAGEARIGFNCSAPFQLFLLCVVIGKACQGAQLFNGWSVIDCACALNHSIVVRVGMIGRLVPVLVFVLMLQLGCFHKQSFFQDTEVWK